MHNALARTPLDLPDPDRTVSVWRSRTIGGDGYNEILMDDAPGKERLWLRAERDHRLQVNRSSKVDVDETSSVLAFTSSWSFPADFERLTPSDVASDLARPSWWSTWSRYLIDRTRAGDPVATGGMAYFPQQLSAALPPSRSSNVLGSTVSPMPMGPPAP